MTLVSFRFIGGINHVLGSICVNRVMKIVWNQLNRSRWAALLPRDASALQQSWGYGAAIQSLGRDVHRAEISDANGPLALVQVISRRVGTFGTVALLSRGPIMLRGGDQAGCLQLVRSTLPGYGLNALIATPEQQTGRGMALMTPGHMAELPLSDPAETMRAAMHGKWRNRLVRAEKSGLQVTQHKDAHALEWIIAKDLAQQRLRGFRALPPTFLKTWADTGRGYALYIAASRDEPIAAMLFLDHAPGVTYQIGWSAGMGRALGAHNLILWRAMQDFAENGRRRMDLGPLDTVNLPGLARFKLGTGAKIRVLGKTSLIFPSFADKSIANTIISRVLTQRSLQ